MKRHVHKKLWLIVIMLQRLWMPLTVQGRKLLLFASRVAHPRYPHRKQKLCVTDQTQDCYYPLIWQHVANRSVWTAQYKKPHVLKTQTPEMKISVLQATCFTVAWQQVWKLTTLNCLSAENMRMVLTFTLTWMLSNEDDSLHSTRFSWALRMTTSVFNVFVDNELATCSFQYLWVVKWL